jgi:hypothetical protein
MDQADNINTCKQCLQKRIQFLREEEDFRQKHTPLRSLELFSGMGSFTHLIFSMSEPEIQVLVVLLLDLR